MNQPDKNAIIEEKLKCPTCGANVRVEAGNTTQFYVPVESIPEDQIRQDERTKFGGKVIELIDPKIESRKERGLDVVSFIDLKKSIEILMLPQPEPDKFEAEAERMISYYRKMEEFYPDLPIKQMIIQALKKDPKEI
jgi:hypothetical protein